MEQKQRLFIYDRKEVGVLFLLAVMVAVFAFTLGVHLGKRVETKILAPVTEAHPAATVPDELPNRQDLTEASKGAPKAADETLNQAIHDETTRTGVKLEVKRQIELPSKLKAENGGKTTLALVAADRDAPPGKFTLQVGSHPNITDAKDQTDALEALGMKPFLREATVKGKGKWYRVFVGGYATKEAAENAGSRFRSQHVIESFIVAKRPE